MLGLLKNKRILVVVAHPDDELLGVGATINTLTERHNCIARAVILGEGITSRSDQRDPQRWQQELKKHRENIYQAQKIIGYQSIGIYTFPDNRFDTVDLLNIVKVIEKEKTEFKPDVIFTHYYDDLNIDHQKTFNAVITATRPMKEEYVNTIITFETPSATEWNFRTGKSFSPNLWFEISEKAIKAKQDAMDCYEYEKREYPHPRSNKALKSLAEKRGVEIGVGLAEAFCLIRTKIL